MHAHLYTCIYNQLWLYALIFSDNLAKQLYWAKSNDQEVLELLQRGAPPNSDYYTREQSGVSPLHKACAWHLRSAEILIKFGAILTAKNNHGSTPLHSACRNNSKGTAKLLLEHHCPTSEPAWVFVILSRCVAGPLFVASKISY